MSTDIFILHQVFINDELNVAIGIEYEFKWCDNQVNVFI